jgi:hypothetical protein
VPVPAPPPPCARLPAAGLATWSRAWAQVDLGLPRSPSQAAPRATCTT